MDLYIRVGSFLLILVLINLYELWLPWRKSIRYNRWIPNYGLVLWGTLLVYLVFPMSSTFFAEWVSSKGYGLFNQFDMNLPLSFVLGLILLDLAIYGQHWFFHKWTWGWRLHRIHHCDLHLDASSALRFHPLEILISMAFKFFLIGTLGLSFWTVLTFEVILNGCAIFNHGNIQIPHKLEKWIRFLIVTPDMHRVHHSQVLREMNSNYGFNLSIWDRLFKTYTSLTCQQELKLGLEGEKKPQSLWQLLLMPFHAYDE